MANNKKTYQFDLTIRLMAEAESVDHAFEAALGKLDPEFVQIRSEVSYKDVTPRKTARIDPTETVEMGIIAKQEIGIVVTDEEVTVEADGDADAETVERIKEGLTALIESIMDGDTAVNTEPSPEQLLKDLMGEDN